MSKQNSEIEKYQQFGDPFYPTYKRHFRGHRTTQSPHEVHPALIIGEWPDDYISMGAESVPTKKENARKRKKYILTPQNKNKEGRPTRIRKQIEVSPKRFFSPEKYEDLKLNQEQNAVIDKQVEKKRTWYKKSSQG